MITKLFSRYDIKVLRFDKKSLFNTVLGFSPYWDYKNFIPIGDNEYYSERNRNLSKIKNIRSKCNVFDGSVVNGSTQPIIYKFVLEKPPGYKVFCDPETTHHKKINKSVLNTITFYLEDDDHKEVNFNGETFNFTLKMIKI